MNKDRHKKGMWQYLESVGVLEKGSDAEIKAAKQTYRKKYFLEFKRKQRTVKPEFNVSFSKDNDEFERVAKAASRHKMTMTAFVRSATLAYLNNSFLVPNREQVASLEQILADCLNEIKTIVSSKEKFFWERDQKLEKIEKRIEKLEVQVNDVFRNPPLLTSHDYKNKIA